MDIKQILEELETFQIAYQLNEMAIRYGTNQGTYNNIIDGYKKLMDSKNGFVLIKEQVNIQKEVTRQEVQNKQFNPIQLNVPTTRSYPIVLVWGEPDKKINNKLLFGHGLSHIIQGHKDQIKDVFNKLQKIIVNRQIAKPDKYGNYTIREGQYRFCFSIQDNKELGAHAVLITAYKRV